MKLLVRFILLGLIVINTSCQKKPLRTDASVKNYVLNNLKSNSGFIDIRNYNDAKWDKLYVIPSYSSEKSFNSTLDEYSGYILDSGINVNDGISLVALFDGPTMISLT